MDLSGFVDVKKKVPQEVSDEKLEVDVTDIQEGVAAEDIERFLPWFLKYKVEKFDDLVRTKEIDTIVNFIEKFTPGKSLLLYGQPGCGKTTTLTLIGEYYDYEIFEMNASDTRNKRSILESVGDVIKQKSLFAKKKLILIDEADGVSGRDDRGGIAELVKIVKESSYPVVFTANDGDSDKIKALKKVAKFINFENHSYDLLKGIAMRIFESESVEFDESELVAFINQRSSVDIRGFINDLQASVFETKFSPYEQLEIRDYKKKIEQLLSKIYFSSPEDAYLDNFNTDVLLDDLFLFMEENVPSVYAKRAIAQAFAELGKADVFRGRIIRRQHWRFLVYVNFYLTYGVSSHKDQPKKLPVKRNSRILKKWMYGNKYGSLRSRTKVEKGKQVPLMFIELLAKVYGRSATRVRKDDLRFFVLQYRNDEEFARSMDEKFFIDEKLKKALLEY